MSRVKAQAQRSSQQSQGLCPYLNLLGLLVFASILAMILAQAQSQRLESLLYLGRWVPLGLLTVYAAGQWVLKPKWSGPMIRRGKGFDIWILCWVALTYISAVYSIAPQATVRLATTLVLGYGAVFWGVWHYANRYSEERVVTLILVCASLIVLASWGGLIGGVGQAFGTSVPGRSGGGVGQNLRFRGVMENPNSLGMLCAFTLPLFLGTAIRKDSDVYGEQGKHWSFYHRVRLCAMEGKKNQP